MSQVKDNKWFIEIKAPFDGYAPLYWEDSYPEFGNANQAGAMSEVDIINPNWLTQGPGLATLTNGDQAGVVTELIHHILDRAESDDETYAVSTTKLFKLSSTTVDNNSPFPHTITNAVQGESVCKFQGKLYYFFNKSSGGDIGQYDMASTFDDDWGSTNDTALQNAPHPSLEAANKMIFGNGQYVGSYDGTTLDCQDLDFKADAVVVHLAYTQARYWIAVNWPNVSGNNKNEGRIYIWDGESSSWDDSILVGGRIGCIWAEAGTIFVIFEDITNGVCKVGYVSGNAIKTIPASEFYGSLPMHYQKTKYKNLTIFVSSGQIKAFGAQSDLMSAKVFDLASGGYSNIGGLATPFGTPIVASRDASSNYKLAKFNGYSVNANWKSLMFNLCIPNNIGIIDKVEVITNQMSSGARVDLSLKCNQGENTWPTSAWQIKYSATNNQRRHIKKLNMECEDFRIELDWSNGSESNPAKIKKIFVSGHYVGKN